MLSHRRYCLVPVLFVSSFILHPSSFLRADGGTLQISQRRGTLLVSVFTSPMPLRTGIVDVSVLVLDSRAGMVRTDVPVAVGMFRLSDSDNGTTVAATSAAATNKLFRAAKLQVPYAGAWRVNVRVDRDESPITVDVVIGDGLPAWWDMGLWLSWPFLAVLLFGVHRWRMRRHGQGVVFDRRTSMAISGRQL